MQATSPAERATAAEDPTNFAFCDGLLRNVQDVPPDGYDVSRLDDCSVGVSIDFLGFDTGLRTLLQDLPTSTLMLGSGNLHAASALSAVAATLASSHDSLPELFLAFFVGILNCVESTYGFEDRYGTVS